MRVAITAAFALLLAQAGQPVQNTTQQQQRQTLPAGIEGLVLQAGSGDPVAKAQVTITRVITPPVVPPTAANPLPVVVPIPPTFTDPSGKFSFANLEPGPYRIIAGRNGFVRMNYGERYAGGPGTTIDLPSGQTLKDVTFRLVPTAAVSGRIRDFNGEPVGGLMVSLLKNSYNTAGQRTFQTVVSGRTDDRGEYRMFWLSPGRYYLSVVGNRNALTTLLIDGVLLAGGASPNEIAATGMATVFYPGTVDPLRASTIEVVAGRDVAGIDMVLPQQQVYRVRGRVVDSSTGQPPRTVSISLIPRDSSVATLTTSTSPNYNPTNGTFELRDVVPGAYWLRAQASDSATAQTITANLVGRTVSDALTSVSGARSAAQISLDVAADAEGVVLSLSSGVSIPGVLRVEGPPLPPSTTSTRVTLRTTAPNGLSSPLQPVNADGTFTLLYIFPGEYRLFVTPMPQDYYIKEARIEQTDVLNQPWVIGSAMRGSLEIVLGSGAGQVDATVLDARTQPVSSIQTWLLPDQDRGRTELIRSGVTDQNGRVTLRGVPPGNYKLFAWEGLETNAFFDPEVMRQYEQQGKPVKIAEGAKVSTEVKLIPAVQ